MLAQLSTLKLRLGIEQFETTDDALLISLLQYVSGRFSCECHRIFDYGTDVTYVFRGGIMNIPIDRSPIESVTRFELKNFEIDEWITQVGIKYMISPWRNLVQLREQFGCACQIGRITYSGGYVLPGVTPTDNQVALPYEIEYACAEQAAYWYQRRTQLGLRSAATEGGLVQQFQTSDLLPQVRAVLRRYDRFAI